MVEKENFLQYLPEIFSQPERTLEPVKDTFVARFLHIFEDLNGALEAKVDRVPQLFQPWGTPKTFLPWLASWFAVQLGENWTDREKRAFLNNIAQFYRQRGTLEGLKNILHIYLGTETEIKIIEDRLTEIKRQPDETDEEWRLRNEYRKHTFTVKITFQATTPAEVQRQRIIAQRILRSEKPAHTHFRIDATEFDPNLKFLVGVKSRVGLDTFLS
ncbi:MAG: phage tail protein I [bacterium]